MRPQQKWNSEERGYVARLVRDYDEALAYFTRAVVEPSTFGEEIK